VRPGVHVDALDRLGDRARSGIRLAHVGRLEPRRGGGGELAAELAEDEVLRARSMRPNAAASQNAVEPPLPRMIS
jgi:hypothetical protein